mgnify:CR=1 FL=1
MKIDDYFIRKISVATSLLGIVFLAVFLPQFSPKETQIREISESNLGEIVLVKGIAQNVQFKKNTLTLDVFGTAKIHAVKFYPTEKELEIAVEGNFLEITGTVKKYKGNLEIEAKSVKKID